MTNAVVIMGATARGAGGAWGVWEGLGEEWEEGWEEGREGTRAGAGRGEWGRRTRRRREEGGTAKRGLRMAC